MANENELLGCGCKVYQKKLGTTTWNRLDQCNLHFAAKELLEALQRIIAVKYPQECIHGEEPWYCDCCRHAWELALVDARKSGEAAIKKAETGE